MINLAKMESAEAKAHTCLPYSILSVYKKEIYTVPIPTHTKLKYTCL